VLRARTPATRAPDLSRGRTSPSGPSTSGSGSKSSVAAWATPRPPWSKAGRTRRLVTNRARATGAPSSLSATPGRTRRFGHNPGHASLPRDQDG